MANYRTQILTTKSVEEVFDYMAVFSNAAEWDPGVESASRSGDGPPTEGEAFILIVKMGKRTLPMTYEITNLDRPSRVVLRSETDRLVSVDTIAIRDTPAGTVMDYQASLQIKGALKIFDPVLRIFFKRIGDAGAEGLREYIT